MPGTQFRRATEHDIAIYESWFEDAELARRLSGPTPQWREFIESPGQAFWAALDPADRVLACFQTGREADGAGWIDCAIDPALRGQGRMVAILSDFIAGPGSEFTRLIAEVEPANLASVALLRRCGFAEIATRESAEFLHFERLAGRSS